MKVVAKILGLRSDKDDLEESSNFENRFPPLEPDLLGGWLLVDVATDSIVSKKPLDQRTTDQAIDTDAWIAAALQVSEMDTVETIRLLSLDFPTLPATLSWTESLLRNLMAINHDDASDRSRARYDLAASVGQIAVICTVTALLCLQKL